MIPKIYGYSAHWKEFNCKRVKQGEYVIKKSDRYYLMTDRCHHRGFHLFHSLKDWDNIDLDRYLCPMHGQKGLVDKLIIKELDLDHTGLVTDGWRTDPEQAWVKKIAAEDLTYHSTVNFSNRADWRFQMEINADMSHVKHIHPWLYSTIDLDEMRYEYGVDYLIQHWSDEGWWSSIYPFYQFEWQTGAVYFAELKPESEDYYTVEGHFYFDDPDSEQNQEFKALTLDAYQEDIDHVRHMGRFYGPYHSDHPLEEHVNHWHDWYWKNRDHIVI
jgi:hypothetical protein